MSSPNIAYLYLFSMRIASVSCKSLQILCTVYICTPDVSPPYMGLGIIKSLVYILHNNTKCITSIHTTYIWTGGASLYIHDNALISLIIVNTQKHYVNLWNNRAFLHMEKAELSSIHYNGLHGQVLCMYYVPKPCVQIHESRVLEPFLHMQTRMHLWFCHFPPEDKIVVTHFVENGLFLQDMGYVYLQYTHMFYVFDNKWVD